MRGVLFALLLVPVLVGCGSDRFTIKTHVAGQVETRLDVPPVSISAG